MSVAQSSRVFLLMAPSVGETICGQPAPGEPHPVLGPRCCGKRAIGPDPDPEISYRMAYCEEHLEQRQAEYRRQAADADPTSERGAG